MTYEEHEERGREKFERNCKLPHTFTNQSDKWDVSTTGHDNTFNIEIKDRDIPYTKYAEEGYWLEKIKYDALMQAFSKTGSLPIYLNYFQDNIGIYWKLSALDTTKIKWVQRYATKSTAEGTYGAERVLKTVMFLLPDDGRKFKYE